MTLQSPIVEHCTKNKTPGSSTPQPAKPITENGTVAAGKTKSRTPPATTRRSSPQRQAGLRTPSPPVTVTKRAHTRVITESEKTPQLPTCILDNALNDHPCNVTMSENSSEGQNIKSDSSQAKSANLWELFTVADKEHSSACSSSANGCTEKMDHSKLSKPNFPVCLISTRTDSSPSTVKEEDDMSMVACTEINHDKNIMTISGSSSLSSVSEPSFLNSEQKFVPKDDLQSSKHWQSTITSQGDEDKFTVQEFLSSTPEVVPSVSSAPEVAPSVSSAPEIAPFLTPQSTSLEELTSVQSSKKEAVPHLNPSVDHVVQNTGHNRFCVNDEQPVSESVEREAHDIDIIKHLNVVREDANVRSSSSNVLSSGFPLVAAGLDISEANTASKTIVSSDVAKLSAVMSEASNRIETSHTKETLDVTSFRQRADALEGLLELSAELLENHRLEELAIVLKPFGKNKVSPRETAIWLARSFKGMMNDEPGCMSL
jgi:NIMA (never in mitosis gene a)-related kinase 1/4/5